MAINAGERVHCAALRVVAGEVLEVASGVAMALIILGHRARGKQATKIWSAALTTPLYIISAAFLRRVADEGPQRGIDGLP